MKTPDRRRVVSTMILAALLVLAACERSEEGPTPTDQYVLLLLKTRDNPFFRDIEASVAATLEGHDLEVIARSGRNEGDVTTQRQVLESVYDQYVSGRDSPRVAGVLITPSGSGNELTLQIAQFSRNGVPVIVIDTRIDPTALQDAGAEIATFIGSENREGGRLAAETLVAAMSSVDDEILLLNGVQGHASAEARRAGFREALDSIALESGRSFNLTERTANWRRSEARGVLDGMLALGRSYGGVFAANDEMALGAAEAYRQAGAPVGEPPLVGFDAIDEAREAVRNGQLTATIAQDPAEMGRAAARSLLDLFAGQEVEREQVIPLQVIAGGGR